MCLTWSVDGELRHEFGANHRTMGMLAPASDSYYVNLVADLPPILFGELNDEADL